jgi:hypothetical protein
MSILRLWHKREGPFIYGRVRHRKATGSNLIGIQIKAYAQLVTLTVNVFSQLNPPLNSTLTLTVTGLSKHYYFDFQPISVSADTVREQGFTWSIPNVAGTYIVEVSLVPAQLTAYDTAWLSVK